MPLRYLAIVVLLLTTLPVAGQAIEIKFIPRLTDLSPAAGKSPASGEISDLDYWGSRMIRHFRSNSPDSLRYSMERLLLSIPAEQPLDQQSLAYILKYADYCSSYDQMQEAKKIYHFVATSTSEDDYLHWLAKWHLAIIDESLDRIDATRRAMYELLEGGSWNEHQTAELIYLMGVTMPDPFRLDHIERNFAFYTNAQLRPEEQFVLRAFLSFTLASSGDPRAGAAYRSLFDLRQNATIPERLFPTFQRSLSSYYLEVVFDYERALAETKKLVDHSLGEGLSFPEMLRAIEEAETLLALNPVDKYSTALLYQTRLGGGIEPVIQAFELKYAVYARYLEHSLKEPLYLKARTDPYNEVHAENLIIIGNYVYQQTGNREYLDRSIRFLDAMGALGILHALHTDVEERLRQQKIVNGSPVSSIAELRELVAAGRKKAKAAAGPVEMDLSGPLPIPQDSSAHLHFYANSIILYRVFRTPETLRVDILDPALPRARELTAAIPELMEDPARREQLATNNRELFGLLLGDLRKELPPKLHLMAHGFLESIPFAALRMDTTGEAPRYLGVEHAISRQFSLRTMQLLTEKTSRAPDSSPLALAPSFGNDYAAAAAFRDVEEELAPLTYNQRELADLEEMGGGRFFYGDDAQLGAYLDYAPRHSIIHLATHAVADQEDGLRSRFFLLSEAEAPVALHADDVARMDLRADLVTLSACESSAGGRHVKEGTVGLTRAFLAAGGRSVVSSRWSVDDYATAEFMRPFYRSVRDGQPAYAALRDARRAYLRANPDAHPAEWATFEAWGGLATPAWEDQPTLSFWWYLAGPLLLIGGVFLYSKRAKSNAAA